MRKPIFVLVEIAQLEKLLKDVTNVVVSLVNIELDHPEISTGFRLTNVVDGSEDNEIHCFKPDGPVPTSRDFLKQARAEKKNIELMEEINLTEDENNNVYDSEASVDG